LRAFENKRFYYSIEDIIFVIQQLIDKNIEPGIYQVADDEAWTRRQVEMKDKKTRRGETGRQGDLETEGRRDRKRGDKERGDRETLLSRIHLLQRIATAQYTSAQLTQFARASQSCTHQAGHTIKSLRRQHHLREKYHRRHSIARRSRNKS